MTHRLDQFSAEIVITPPPDPRLQACPKCSSASVAVQIARPDTAGAAHLMYWVHCQECLISGPIFTNESKAIANWNTRTVPSPPAPLEGEGEIVRSLHEDVTEYENRGMEEHHDAILKRRAASLIPSLTDLVGELYPRAEKAEREVERLTGLLESTQNIALDCSLLGLETNNALGKAERRAEDAESALAASQARVEWLEEILRNLEPPSARPAGEGGQGSNAQLGTRTSSPTTP